MRRIRMQADTVKKNHEKIERQESVTHTSSPIPEARAWLIDLR